MQINPKWNTRESRRSQNYYLYFRPIQNKSPVPFNSFSSPHKKCVSQYCCRLMILLPKRPFQKDNFWIYSTALESHVLEGSKPVCPSFCAWLSSFLPFIWTLLPYFSGKDIHQVRHCLWSRKMSKMWGMNPSKWIKKCGKRGNKIKGKWIKNDGFRAELNANLAELLKGMPAKDDGWCERMVNNEMDQGEMKELAQWKFDPAKFQILPKMGVDPANMPEYGWIP